MQVVSASLIEGKKVLLRLDIDVPLRLTSFAQDEPPSQSKWEVADDYRLIAGMPTLELCLNSASKVIILGHIGRPGGKKVKELSVAPIYDWLINHGFEDEFESGKLSLLENLRFEKGEEEADIYYARSLAALGNFYVNEAFASHHKAASTTILPMILSHAVGLQFAKEVETLTKVHEAPRRVLVAIIGGVKVEDKLPAAIALAKIADKILVGGKIANELMANSYELPANIMLADLTVDGEDISVETLEKWTPIIAQSKMIVWNGPLGKIEENTWKESKSTFQVESLGSARGTYKIAQMIIKSGAESIVGGGDTIGFLDKTGLLDDFEKKGFVSTGGGAMLKFLEKGTLPTIEALK